MTLEPTSLALALVVFTGYAVQTASGFGAMLVCVTLGAHLLPVRELVALLVPVSLLQNGYILARHRDGVRWRLLGTRVLPLMGAGMAAGFVAFRPVAGRWLRIGCGALVLVLALRELWGLLRRDDAAERSAAPRPRAPTVLALLGAGVMHGVYAIGGPLLVYAVGREDLDRHAFRSTLSAVWFLLGGALLLAFALDGRYHAASLRTWLVLLPALPTGIAVGELLHRRVSERRFRTLVQVLLVAAAASLLVRA